MKGEVKYTTALTAEAQKRIEEIKSADILIGIPSYNNADTIGHVVKAACEGLSRYFPSLKSVLMNSDGGSTDGTRDVVKNTVSPGIDSIICTYRGIPGKGSAFRAIFETVAALGVRACIVVDSDLRSITPQWLHLLGDPLVNQGFGYVAPFYSRHKYDGTITNNITYPMTRTLYGQRIRQPIGGDFGFSGELARHYAEMDVWETSVAKYGIDIWMTTTALCEGYRICQAHLGAKIHDAKDPAASLGPMFREVVGTLFGLMKTYREKWITVTESEDTLLYGDARQEEPEPVRASSAALIDSYKSGFHKYNKIWKKIVSPENFSFLERLARKETGDFELPPEVWCRIVYDFAVYYNMSIESGDMVVDYMTPLYFGRTGSFVIQSQDLSTSSAEKLITEQAETFEQHKPYLLERWNRFIAR